MIISKLLALTLGVVLIAGIITPQAFAQERTGDSYTGPTGDVSPQIDLTCLSNTGVAAQCAVVTGGTLPPYALAVVTDQGTTILNPDCEIILLSTGVALDADNDLNTIMGGAGCGLNPDGFATNDCADITVIPLEPSVVLAWSAEWPEFLGSTFTDWDRVAGFVSFSIEDWVGQPSLVENAAFGPSSIGSVTEAFIPAGVPIELRVADSGDANLDTGKIVVPESCLEAIQIPIGFCGDGIIDSPETCDDGLGQIPPVGGDGCSATCQIESVGGVFEGVDTTALLVAGAQANAMWILPVLAAIAIGVVVIRRIR